MRSCLLLVLCLALLGAAGPGHAEALRSWTVMVFLNGDNNLDSAGVADVNEMERVGSTDEVAILVQHDREGDGGTKRLFIEKDDSDEILSPVLEELPEVDMGDWRQAAAFFDWAVERYPAKHYLFVFWNHGLGWEDKAGQPALFKGISYDDDSGNHIHTEDLARCVAAMDARIGRKLDVLGFDACLMQMAEVAAEVAPHVRYQVAAEEIEPGGGWPYEDMLSSLVQRPNMDGRRLSEMLVDVYMKSYEDGSQGSETTNQSALDLSRLPAFRTKLDALAEAIMADEGYMGSVLDAAQRAQAFAKPQYKDLGDFLRRLAEGSESKILRQRAREALNFLVERLVLRSAYHGEKLAGSTGLSFWFPSRRQFEQLHLRYARLAMSVSGRWDEALDAIHHPEGAVLRIIGVEGDGTQGIVSPGDEMALSVQLRNDGANPSSPLRLRLVTTEPMVELLDSGVALGVLEAGKKATAPVQRLRIHPDCPVGRELDLAVEVRDEEGHVLRRALRINVKQGFVPTQSVLLVVLSTEHPFTAHYDRALSDAGIAHDLWPIDYYGAPSLRALEHYVDGAVVFHAAAPGDLEKLGTRHLATYLDAGGSLFLSGQDVGYKLKNKDFLSRYLHARFVQDNVGCEALRGIDCLEGFRTSLVGGDGADKQKWLDEIDPLGPARAILRYDAPLPGKGPISSACAGLTVAARGFRVVYLAFGLEGVATAGDRAKLSKMAMAHCLVGKAAGTRAFTNRAPLSGEGLILRGLCLDDAEADWESEAEGESKPGASTARRSSFAILHGR